MDNLEKIMSITYTNILDIANAQNTTADDIQYILADIDCLRDLLQDILETK